MGYVVGLDWGGGAHALCVIDTSTGSVTDRFEVAHDAAGLKGLLRRLARHGAPTDLPVAIERPSGLVVDTLVAAGRPMVPIHPNAVKASRPRYRAAGGKERAIVRHWSEDNGERGDAYLPADLLRTDGHRFRPLSPVSDEIKALRALVRGRDDLVATRVQLANQLRALLEGFWPGAAAIFADVDRASALAFLDRYSTPDAAARLGVKRLASFLAQHRYCGRRSPEELLARLRAAPEGLAGPTEAEAKGEMVRALVAVLTPLVARIADLTARIRHETAASQDGRILMSFPRAGQPCAAQILAELGDDRARYLTPDQLAADAGLAPVTRQSGKSRGVSFRWACNRRLRAALTCFTDDSRHDSTWAAGIYARARGRGCRHPHAIRILWRAWQDRKPCDPALHAAAAAMG